MTLPEILAQLPDLSIGERKLIEYAHQFGEEAHRPQKRKSGEPYFIHCEAVALILAEWQLDAATIAAGLLHDVVEDTPVTLAQLEDNFGYEVAQLVDGVTKMSKVASQNKELSEAEYLRKTINSMSNDVRVIFIKLADRLHNMRTLGSLKPDRQQAISQETMVLFAPLANRLGMWRVKADLEDLAFRYLEPEEYRKIAHKVSERQAERQQMIEDICRVLEIELHRYHLEATIQGRPKNLYSIHKKMERKHISFEETYDVRGIRVIVEDMLDCYRVLGLVHSLWKPIPGEFDDYIGAPKDNFYQSLHTAVISPDGVTFEVQIRTWEMHHHAEYGIAAHWRYKAADQNFDQQIERRMNYLRNLIQPAETEENSLDFMKVVIESIDDDRIFAHTPKGDVIDLPRGATPIDFAYYIHTEVGHRCRGARVNNRLVPLDYPIKSGDRIEIITSTRGGPSLDWLDKSLGYVHTSRALSKIREWFRHQDREKIIAVGREALENRMKQLGVEKKPEDIRATEEMPSLDALLEAIGRGQLSPTEMVIQQLESDQNCQPEVLAPVNAAPVIGVRGYEVNIAQCCHPQPGDKIVGYITNQATVSVHREDCPNLNSYGTLEERLVPVSWGRKPAAQVFTAPVEIRAYDRAGLMGEIGAIAAQENINMTDVNIMAKNGLAVFHVKMEIENFAMLSRVLNRIQSLENVIEARRKVAS